MSEEATEELETTETATTETTETPLSEADASTEEEATETGTENTETEEDIKRRNQEFALRRKTAKQARELRESKQRIAELEAKTLETTAPKADDYENYDDYIQASIDYGIKQKTQTAPQYDPLRDMADDISANGTQKYKDFNEVAFASPEMLPVMSEFENAEDIAYYLGQNPQDAQRIQKMSSVGMAREFALIEAKVNMPKPRTTNAPKPVKPIESAPSATVDPDKMTMAEYAAWRNKQQYG